MKFFLIVCAVTQIFSCISSAILPEHFPEACKQSDPDYKGCVLKSLNKIGPYLLKGMPEFNIPKLDPLEIPLIAINRTLNQFISLNAVVKNVKILGLSKTWINDLKVDLENMAGSIKITQPDVFVTMEYDVNGQLFTIPMNSRGFFKGNFTDTTLLFKGNMKPIEKDGVKYFALDKFKLKSRVGDGYIKMTAKNPDNQFAADLITNFFNDNPRRVLDALSPFYVDRGAEFYKSIVAYGLSKVPADELLPQ